MTGRIDRSERFQAAPGVVRRHHAAAPGVVERGLEIGEHPVGARAPAPHRFRILSVECSCIGRRAGAGTPIARALGHAAVPIGEPLRGELVHGHVAERGQNVAANHALDHLGASGAAPAKVVEVVGDRALYGVGTVVARRQARGEPLLVRPPPSRRALRL